MCVVYNHYTNMYIEQSAVFLLTSLSPGQGLQLVDVPLSALLFEALHNSHQVRPSSDDELPPQEHQGLECGKHPAGHERGPRQSAPDGPGVGQQSGLDLTKLGLSAVSLSFDLVFLLQHFVLYRNRDPYHQIQ